MLSGIHSYSQELRWRETNELTKSLYQSMVNFANEKSRNKQKRMKQQEVKNFLEAHFTFQDTIPKLVFFDKNQIVEWGTNFTASPFMPYSLVQSKEFNVNNSNIFVLMVDGCSGVQCLDIYIFVQEGKTWQLIAGSERNINIGEFVNVRIDNDQEKIVFETVETNSRKIGEFAPKP